MPFDTSSGDALDSLRASQPPVKANSESAIDEDTVDLLSQFHEDSKKEEEESKKSAHSSMSDFKSGKGTSEQMHKAIDDHNRTKLRNQFMSDYMNSQDSADPNEPGSGAGPGND